MKLRILAATVLAVLPLLGCSTAGDTGAIVGPTWRLTVLRGEAVEATPEVTAVFAADGTVAGSGGCNRYHGGATATADTLKVSLLASTLMACEPQTVMDREARYLQTLEAAVHWGVVGDTLTITDASGAALLTYVRTGA